MLKFILPAIFAASPALAKAHEQSPEEAIIGIVAFLAIAGVVLLINLGKQSALNDPSNTSVIHAHQVGEDHNLPAGPVRVVIYRQSGNVHTDAGVFHSPAAGIRRAMQTMNRAGIDAVSVRRNTAREYSCARLHHSHRGSNEGKKVGSFTVTSLT